MLILENVHKSFVHYGTMIDVLKGVDLEVKRGQSLAVMGASGVGKSTLLNIMGSLEPPTEGHVIFEDRYVYDMDEQELCLFRNKQIGFVFQFHHLLSEFTAMENTMMPALLAGYPKNKASSMAGEFLEKVGLNRRLKHRPGELSGGEQQRVAIARALVMRPKIILADEPTGNLDWSTGEEIAELLLELIREQGVAMVIATHNKMFADMMSLTMEIVDGKIQ